MIIAWHIPWIGGRRISFDGGAMSLATLAAGACLITLLVWLYRRERALVSRRVGIALVTLRAGAAVALVFALLNPIGERQASWTTRGRIVLGVDLSDSMNTVDATRSGEESTRLAEVVDPGGESGSSAYSRREIAARLLSGPWLSGLRAIGEVEVVAFARRAARVLSADALAERIGASETRAEVDISATDWQRVLEHALAENDAPVAGIVLMTDGRQNVPDRARQGLVDRLRARGIPVHGVIVGSPRPPRDAAIAAVRLPDRAAKGDSADVVVAIKIDGEVPGAAVPVTLTRAGRPAITKQANAPRDSSRFAQVSFSIELDTAGVETFEISVGPMSEDARPDNDRRTVSLEVVDEKIRVLLIDAEPRWEFRFVHSALSRDDNIALESVIFRQQPGPESAASYASALPEPGPDGHDPLSDFDLIVLGDTVVEDWDDPSWSRLARFVDARGGTLVWCAGRHTIDMLSYHESARMLIPVIDPKPPADESARVFESHPSLPAGLRVRPRDARIDIDWPMLRLGGTSESDRAAWERLPPLPWFVTGRLKPGATPLAFLDTREFNSTPNGAARRDEDAAVIATMPYGLGHVFWIGTDGTWRWRFGGGDDPHMRFWRALVRWGARERLSAGNELIQFGTARRRHVEGEPIVVRARFAENARAPSSNIFAAARVYRMVDDPVEDPKPASQGIATVPLRPSQARPRMLEAALPDLPSGRYSLALEIPDFPGTPQDRAVFEVESGDNSERIELAATAEHLEPLARATGGRIVHDFEADALFDAIRPRSITRTRIESTTLWDRPWALICFFALLTAEWTLRKHVGLP